MSNSATNTATAMALESVLRTHELSTRPSRPPDYQTENHALLTIAQHMADSPQTTLQKLVEVALEICRAGSAGVSLVSEKSGDFYWPAIAGAWKLNIGGGTPRHFGPCGVVLDRNTVQLFTHPERCYPYLIPVAPTIEEVLLTPFYVAGKAVGTVWVVAHDPDRKFDAEDLRLIESLGRFAAAVYPLSTALDALVKQDHLMRDVNENLVLSSVRQHELTEQAQKAESLALESEQLLKSELAERKRVEEALQESEVHFTQLAEAIPVIVWTANAQGWIDWYNDRWYEYTGQSRDDAAGWGWQNAHHPEDFPRVLEAWSHSIATGKPFEMEFRLRRHDGVFHHFLTRIHPSRNEQGEIVRWYGSNVDIQAHKTALEQSQGVAKTLQSIFLPRSLPHNDKVRFDASYSAAEKDTLIGGDWLEATQLPDGRYLISVGDVTGHGLDASIIAGRLRQAITDFAFTNDNPAVVLSNANRILRFQHPDVYATAVVGFVDRDCTRLTYASAGHPAPLLATSRTVPAHVLPLGGVLLGYGDHLGSISHSIDICPGSVLAFYTDGITEFARDIDSAEAALRAAVAEVVGDTSIARPAVVIQNKVLGDAPPTDDIALLIVQFDAVDKAALRAAPADFTKTLRFHSSDASAARTCRREMMNFIRHFAVDPDALFTAELIIGEILANTVQHAPGLVEVNIDWSGEKPIVRVVDTGPGLIHLHPEGPQDMMNEHGRGLFLIRTLADDVSIESPNGSGTELRAVLPLLRNGARSALGENTVAD